MQRTRGKKDMPPHLLSALIACGLVATFFDDFGVSRLAREAYCKKVRAFAERYNFPFD
jgi:hypothetical protein